MMCGPICSLVILAASSLPALAAEPPAIPAPPAKQEPIGQVNGTVFDQSQKGIVGLPMALIPQAGSTIYGTSTESGGRFAFKSLDAATYSVILSLPSGGALRKDGIRIRPLFRSIVDFTLAAETLQSSLPSVEAPAGGEGSPAALSLSCTLLGSDRTAVPDALVTLTPVEGQGRFRRCQTGSAGDCAIDDLPAGRYRISAKAPGFLTWSLGPLALKGSGPLTLSLTLVPFPMGFEGGIEDLLIPTDPIAPPPPATGS